MIDSLGAIWTDWNGPASLLLHLLLKMSVVLVVALLLDLVLRRRFVVACSTMWNTTLCLLALMPVACLILPAATFATASPMSAEVSPSPVMSADAACNVIEVPNVPTAPVVISVAPPRSVVARSLETTPPALARSSEATSPAIIPTPAAAAEMSAFPRVSWPGVALALGIVYFVGLLVGFTKLVLAVKAARRLRLTSQPLNDADWQRRLDGWRRQLGLARRVDLRQSPDASVPLVLGQRRPTVIVPADVAGSSEVGCRDAILVHELAHVVRGDFSWQLLQRGLEAMLWFHPLVWLMGRRIGLIRERVCDEFTVHHLGGAETYVETLLAMASRLTRRCTVSLGLAVLRSSNLGERLAAMHDSSGSARCQPGRLVRLAAAAVAIVLAGWFGRAAVADPASPRMPGLPPQAQQMLNEFDSFSQQVRAETERQIAANRAKVEQQLKALQTHYTQQDNLDAAVAIRDQIRLLRAGPAAGDPTVNIINDPGSMTSYKDAIGTSYYIRLQGAAGGWVWGTDVYTHDSNLAAAAVHAGVLEMGQLSVVKVTMVPGQPMFHGSTRHGIASSDWNNSGGYYTGYRIERAPDEIAQLARVQTGVLTLTTPSPTPLGQPARAVFPMPGTLMDYRGNVGQIDFDVVGAVGNNIWGTDVYTDDSPLSTVAVHAGLLQPGQRGVVRVTILAGQNSYQASTCNGVSSSSWGADGGSYSVQLVAPYGPGFIPANPMELKSNHIWDSGAIELMGPRSPFGPVSVVSHRGRIGQTIAMEVVGSTDGTVWGSDVYTDDSSVEAAAVHAGVLKVGERGVVQVTILPGQGHYEASTRNGVTSHPFDLWGGSFHISKPGSAEYHGPAERDPGGASFAPQDR